MELLTKNDLKPIEALQERMVAALEILVGKQPTQILRASEIKKRLGLNSHRTFQERVPELAKFGLFKDGQYSMTEADLEKYILNLKTKYKNEHS